MDNTEFPSDEDLQRMFEAYLKDGRDGVLNLLRAKEQEQQAERQKQVTQEVHHEKQHAQPTDVPLRGQPTI